MSTSSVQVETRGAVALVTLNRPDSANTLNLEMGMDLLAAAMTCGRNPAVRAVVLTGAGRQFCFGGDLRAMVSEGTRLMATCASLPGTFIRQSRISCGWTRRSSQQSMEPRQARVLDCSPWRISPCAVRARGSASRTRELA